MIPKVHKTKCKGSWITVETIIGEVRYDLQITNWQNGEGACLVVSENGKEDQRLDLGSEAFSALRVLLKEHGGFGKEFLENDVAF